MKGRLSFRLQNAPLLAVFLVASASPALAYGPEGLFGGRPEPDSAIVLASPIELKNDRPDRAQSVLEHPRPDYDPVPIEAGSFELFPSIEGAQTYDSNIYAADNKGREDVVNTLRPALTAFSNWGRHAVSMTTFGDLNYNDLTPRENTHNFVTDVNGRYDIVAETWLSGHGGFQALSEPRSSPNAVDGKSPTTFRVANGGLTFYRGVGQMKLTTDYDMKRFDYDPTPTSTGSIDQSGRNRYEQKTSAKVGYAWTQNLQPYVKFEYNWHQYDHNDRADSQGYSALMGTQWDLGGITSLELYAGAMHRDYDSFLSKDVTAPRFGGRVEWNVTGMTSLVLEADRTIEETTLTGFDGYVATGGSATLTHELRRNILLEGDMTYTHDEFKGTGNRADDVFSAGPGVRYLINPNFYTDLTYNWSRRVSDAVGVGYARNLVSLRIGARM